MCIRDSVKPLRRPGDVPDRGVPGVEQVRGGGERARLLVDGDQRGGPPGVAVDGDQRDPRGHLGECLAGRLGRRDDHDARDPLVPVVLDRGGDRGAVEHPHPPHADQEPRRAGRQFEGGQQRGRTVEGRTLRHHADELGPAGHQGAGRAVGPVPQFLDGGPDPQPGLLADVRVSIEDT